MKYIADNIVAIASGAGYAGVGVIRVSGFDLSGLIKSLSAKDALKPRYAHYVDLWDSHNEIIDSGLLLYFPAPNSFTG